MRSKEHAHDYRYFPEPDLPPVAVDPAWLERVRAVMPELPAERRARFERTHDLRPEDADVLTQRKDVADYFEAGVAAGAAPKEMANWTMTELLRLIRDEKLDRALVIREWPVTPAQLAGLANLVAAGTVNRNTAKGLLAELMGTSLDPAELVRTRGLAQVSDTGTIEGVVAEVVRAHPEQVQQFKAGKDKVIGYLVGQAMKASGGKANPKVVQDVLRRALRDG
jgi:aspartyl-tRNA(Asn)/glutamyl-tRNA(Gln) amidotransferase subunit B